MGQRNIYFPENIEEQVEARAKLENKSVSAFVVDVLKKELQTKKFNEAFWKLSGSLSEDFERVNQNDSSKDHKRESFEWSFFSIRTLLFFI